MSGHPWEETQSVSNVMKTDIVLELHLCELRHVFELTKDEKVKPKSLRIAREMTVRVLDDAARLAHRFAGDRREDQPARDTFVC